MWIPNNLVMKQAGIADSYADARAYLDAWVGEITPATSDARRDAFLKAGPEAVDIMQAQGMRLTYARRWTDYYETEYPGGRFEGRTLVAEVFNLRRLGDQEQNLRTGGSPPRRSGPTKPRPCC